MSAAGDVSMDGVEVNEDENTVSSVPSAEGADSIPEGEPSSIQSTSASNDPEKPKLIRPNQETLHTPVFPTDIIEYEWPLKSSERYFLQEQIAELLDVKSFKRKYPDLTRRFVEVPEKEYLIKTHNMMKTIGEHQMHGLTALRSIEVHELMSAEYPTIYSEYQKAAAEKLKMEMSLKQKELDAIKKDEKKLKELRDLAMKSASEFNSDLAAIKKSERAYYWDLQTSIIQSASGRWHKLPKERTRAQPYPCALVHGQFQHYYRKWTAAELRRLPLSSVLDGSHLFAVARPPSPPPIVVTDSDLHPMPSLGSPPSPSAEGSAPRNEEPASAKKLPAQHGVCSLCNQTAKQLSCPMLKCSTCGVLVHVDCIDMPDRMIEVVQSYSWNCIECKKCTVCEKPDDEESMMFCDRCDRGYHTFCVGLSEPPTGAWMCVNFCSREDDREEEKPRVKMEKCLPSTPVSTRSTRSTRRNSLLH